MLCSSIFSYWQGQVLQIHVCNELLHCMSEYFQESHPLKGDCFEELLLVPLGAKLTNCLSIQTSFSTIWACIYRRETFILVFLCYSLEILTHPYRLNLENIKPIVADTQLQHYFFLWVEKAKGKCITRFPFLMNKWKTD